MGKQVGADIGGDLGVRKRLLSKSFKIFNADRDETGGLADTGGSIAFMGAGIATLTKKPIALGKK